MVNEEQATSTVQRPPWGAAALALLSLLALFVNAPKSMILAAVGAAILASYVVSLRLPRHPVAVWVVRLLLFYAIIAANTGKTSRSTYFMDREYIDMFGCLCAVELAVQWWQQRPSVPHGEILVLSWLIFAMAAGSHDRKYIPWFAPLFAIALVAALRGFRARGAAQAQPRAAWPVHARRGAVLAMTLAMGLGTATAVHIYGERVTIYPFSGLFKRYRSGLSGAASPPRLSGTPNLRGLPTRVLRVEGLHGEGYLRGMAFDTYAAGQWGPPITQRSLTPVSARQLNANASGRKLRITRLADELTLLYNPLNVAGVAPMDGSLVEWERDEDRTVRSWTEQPATYTYEAILSTVPHHQGPLCAPLDEASRVRYLGIPNELDPRVRELARSVAGSGDAKRMVANIEHYLQTNHQYSLTVDLRGGDPLNDFLLNKKPAYCTYFATATVIMARCVGVPARLVSGYYAHEQTSDGSVIVRQRDAHAWAECWIEGTGWVTVDATPDAGRPDNAFPPTSEWQKAWEWTRDRASEAVNWIRSHWTTVAMGGAGLVGVYYGVPWLWNRLRRRSRRKKQQDTLYPEHELGALAAGFDRLLRERGLGCAAHRTWREHLTEIAPVVGDRPGLDLELARLFVAAYESARFGRKGDAEAIEGLARVLDELKRAKA